MYEVDIASGMVTLDGRAVGKVEDLLATLTKKEVNRDELDTCYAVATALRVAAVMCQQERAEAEAERQTALKQALSAVDQAQALGDEIARLNDPVRWAPEDVERAAQANLERARFEAAVKARTAELLEAEGLEG